VESIAGPGFQPVSAAVSKSLLQAALRADFELYRAVFTALAEIDTSAFIREGRAYGGALYKMVHDDAGIFAWQAGTYGHPLTETAILADTPGPRKTLQRARRLAADEGAGFGLGCGC
jgi:hypothetical protein